MFLGAATIAQEISEQIVEAANADAGVIAAVAVAGVVVVVCGGRSATGIRRRHVL